MILQGTMRYLILVVAIVLSTSVHAQESASTVVQRSEERQEIAILAKQNLAFHSRPDFYSNVLGVFESGDESTAFGRDAAGDWLQTPDGWVNARNTAAAGNIMSLSMTSEFISLQATGNLELREGPDPSFSQTATLSNDKLTIAVGRNHDGSWVQTPDGWIPSDIVEADRDIDSLPVTFASITVKAARNGAFLNAPTWEANVLEIFERGNDAFAHKRTDDGRWVRTPRGWLNVSQGMEVQGDLTALQVEQIVTVTILADVSIFAAPQHSADAVGSVEQGQTAIALSRTEDGLWLEIPFGWVSAEAVEASGDVSSLRYAAGGILVEILAARPLRNGPGYGYKHVGGLKSGELVMAFGRNSSGSWLQIDSGWLYIGSPSNRKNFVSGDVDIMSLPVSGAVAESSSTTTSTRVSSRATATPAPQSGLDASTIRSLVSRHTDDIRILDIEISNSATTIEYDLKPWPFVPNELIAEGSRFQNHLRDSQWTASSQYAKVHRPRAFQERCRAQVHLAQRGNPPQREERQSHRLPRQQPYRRQLAQFGVNLQIISDSERGER